MLKVYDVRAVILLAIGLMLAGLGVPASALAKQPYKVLYSFEGNPDGESPLAELLSDSSGNIYGTTAIGGQNGLGTAFKLSSTGTENVLFSFGGRSGAAPNGGLIADANGNLYGATAFGGKKCANEPPPARGCGVVFKLTPDGIETVLYAFAGRLDGKIPRARLLMDGAGNLFGTTSEGGNGCAQDRDGCGTVFKIAPDGTETILHAFKGGNDGSAPSGGLILDGAGNLYGTTNTTVFQLAQDGVETVLHEFTGGVGDGGSPVGNLVSDADGNLFGVTEEGGGSGCDGFGCGTVFKISPEGEESILYSFRGGDDGRQPLAGLFRDSNGNLYGTTFRGGNSDCQANEGCGTIFVVTPLGTETVLHTFSGRKDGNSPLASLTAWRHGYLVGTTSVGGTHRRELGTVFKVLLQNE